MRIQDIQNRITQSMPTLTKFGSDYGGWSVITQRLNTNSIVYSFGIGEDISFDLGLMETVKCRVHAFDPTPKSLAWLGKQKLPDLFSYYGVGLAAHDGNVRFHLPKNPEHVSGSVHSASHLQETQAVDVSMLRLQTIRAFLRHTHIDLLKMDIEGSEYAVIDDLLRDNDKPNQLLIEFHHRFESIGADQTRQAIHKLQAAGYHIFHEQNNFQEVCFALDR